MSPRRQKESLPNAVSEGCSIFDRGEVFFRDAPYQPLEMPGATNAYARIVGATDPKTGERWVLRDVSYQVEKDGRMVGGRNWQLILLPTQDKFEKIFTIRNDGKNDKVTGHNAEGDVVGRLSDEESSAMTRGFSVIQAYGRALTGNNEGENEAG